MMDIKKEKTTLHGIYDVGLCMQEEHTKQP